MLRSPALRALRPFALQSLRAAAAPLAPRQVVLPAQRQFSKAAAKMAAKTTDVSTYCFNHTMLRIKDPKVSVDFYTRILGMEKIDEHAGESFTLIFLAYPTDKNASAEEKTKQRSNREGVLELTWNHGTEKEEGQVYASGNEDVGKGFGHIAICVDDLDAACKRFTDLGVKFKKRPEDGKMRNIAFIYDPDGYWVEVIKRQ